ncbi:ABC transporter permease subunit [Brevibacterium sp. 5221]|uniref:ABC transporter permease subunit n=1 Tax=Brevibacterium rongguiense TaxID=2695267 RepID=A0A6N9H4W3_9MICO|nr:MULTISPECIES: ABC transporter permease [Brevibacterium]MYM18816.1 ABC transporter permease subunit [Brevibacterium rongguiense]WAL39885.1 ABC transporter permease [Brevibacterium sp. BRM-1]
MRRFAAKILGPGALAFPTWAYAVFFFVVPVALVLFYSFGYKPDEFTTVATDRLSLERYAESMTGSFLATFAATLRISVLGTILCLLISVPFAYWLAVKVPANRRGVLLAIVMVPFWTNFLVRTLGWQIILSPDGFLSDGLQQLGLLSGPLNILYTRAAVQIGVVYNYLPLMILPLFVAMDSAGQALREASYDLGAGRLSTFFRITMPLAMPGVASGCLLVFIPLTGDYVTATVLGGANGSMIGQIIANQFNTAQNWALGAAMAVVLILVTLAVVAVAAAVLWLGRLITARLTRVQLEGI